MNPNQVSCNFCGGPLVNPQCDRRTERKTGRCISCGRLRTLDGHEYGALVLSELRAGPWSSLESLNRRFAGGLR